MILDKSDRSLQVLLGEARSSLDCDIVAAYGDSTATTFVPGASQGATDGMAPVVAVDAPGIGVQRQVQELRVFNNDDVPHSITLQLVDGATVRIVRSLLIPAGGEFIYTPQAPGYVLPIATATMLGGVMPDGTTIGNNGGAISVTYGTMADTAAEGNDSRIVGALSAATAAATYAPLASPTFTGTVTVPALKATGAITPSSTAGIVGTKTNDNADAGSIGEYISATVLVGSAINLTNNTPANVTSISLTAGDWDVSGTVALHPGSGTTEAQFVLWINTTSATIPTHPNGGATIVLTASFSGDNIVPVGQRRLSLAATTTVYLSVQASFSVSTLSAYGFIGARRVR